MSLAYYKEFSCPTFDYQTGFGSRTVPTKREAVALPALPNLVPLKSIAVKARDLEAETVIKKAIEENRERLKQRGCWTMILSLVCLRPHQSKMVRRMQPRRKKGGGTTSTTETAFSCTTSTLSTSLPQASSTTKEAKKGEETKKVLYMDDNTTLQSVAGESRSSPTTRGLGEHGEEREGKRLRTEDAKKARINRMKMIWKRSYTLDEEVEIEEPEDFEWDSDEIKIPEELWMDGIQEEKPKDPEACIDNIADQLELERLIKMEVVKQATDEDKNITRSVTTKFVRDWRWKEFKGDGTSKHRWLRRSRLVAREYAVDKRDDVFSPASSGHLLRLLPVLTWQRLES